jgi:hypothetical protein
LTHQEPDISGKIDAVAPLLARDLERFETMAQSMLANFHDLGTCWVVGRESEQSLVEPVVNRFRGFRFVPEKAILPDLQACRRMALLRRRRLPGWYIQQLIKLAIADHIRTPYYLTLDADVVCVRPVRYQDLIQDGRALARLSEHDPGPGWYEGAAKILGYARPSPNAHGVTPALLSKEAVLLLRAHLEKRVHPLLRASGLLLGNSGPAKVIAGWPAFLVRSLTWTEYALYHGFLEGHGIAERYHDYRKGVLYDTRNSFWSKRMFDIWVEREVKDFAEGAYFIVTQSNTGVSALAVREKVAHLIGIDGAEAREPSSSQS